MPVRKHVRQKEDKILRAGMGSVWPLLIFFACLALYAATAQRGVSWQDSGIFQHRVVTGTYTDMGGGGLAVMHPFYLKAARLFCLCFPHAMRVYAINLFSGAGMALAAALLFALVRRLTGSVPAALAAAVTLGLAHMAWWLATIAEVYTWSLAFLLAELLCALRVCLAPSGEARQRAWLVLMFLNGMHASLHNVAFLNLPVYGILWLSHVREDRPPPRLTLARAGFCAVFWLAGAALLVGMVARDLGQTRSLSATLKSLLVGARYGATVMGSGGVNLRLAAGNMALAAVSFASPCWLCVVKIGKGAPDRRVFRFVLLALTVIQTLFWIRYFVPDQATFVLPTLGLGAVWLGLGAARCKVRVVLMGLAIGVMMQVAGPLVLARMAQGRIPRARVLPFRDEARYWLVPWKHNERSAQQFVEAVDRQLGAGDLLFGDLTAVNPIVVARAAGMINGKWRLVSEWTGESLEETITVINKTMLDGGSAYVVSAAPGYTAVVLLDNHDFEPEGVLWRMIKKQ